MDLFNQISVLDQERLVEQGTHMQLLDRRGLYANLYRAAVASPTLRSRRRHRLAPTIHF
jgi:ABC-type transport system involved in cytochrome bd biosynthesis fused ATPase/permease subunit